MYSTCLFCKQPLGTNEAIETFPIGRRLAFDAAKGRLWVVCPKCERWNLTPLEERWEAIEQAERLYRDTRKRVATDNIGLAKAPDGTTLVRIGSPLRPEFAAWRYGDQFGRRRRRQILVAGAGVTALGALVAGGAAAGVGVGGFGFMIAKFAGRIIQGSPETIVSRILTDDARLLEVRRRHLAETTISHTADGLLAVGLRFRNGRDSFVGPQAHRIASVIVPKVNRFGGSKDVVATAVREIEHVGSTEAYLSGLLPVSSPLIEEPDVVDQPRRGRRRRRRYDFSKYGLFAMPTAQRLALEMALHEEAERRALEGEIKELERAWHDAEEIAAISDNLLVPASISTEVERLKRLDPDLGAPHS